MQLGRVWAYGNTHLQLALFGEEGRAVALDRLHTYGKTHTHTHTPAGGPVWGGGEGCGTGPPICFAVPNRAWSGMGGACTHEG
eukprot:1157598-Pelagomonas_calceolata.AAC.5